MRGVLCLLTAAAALTFAAGALADVRLTDGAYVSPITGLPATDPTLASCSTDHRQQNEPAVAVNPTNPSLMTAGSNDYCTVPTIGDAWAGFYYSSDSGTSWTDSLLPGYPTDTTAEGAAAPQFGLVGNTGDPTQAWDNFGHVYYGVIGFNRAKPASGSLFVARFTWQAGPRPHYDFTTTVRQGTPSPLFKGRFEDKIGLEVDRGASSPYSGNVYVCNAQFTASAVNNGVFLYRSTDGGRTFSNGTKLSESVHNSQYCDIAVTRNGTVFVAWRQFAYKPSKGQKQGDAVIWVKSTDGGRSFTKPAVATSFVGWDPQDLAGSPEAAAEAMHEACLAGDSTELEACAEAAAEPSARDCGDGPLACRSGYVFFRADTQVRITADPTAGGNPNAAYVVFDGSVPGTETPTGTTYGTREPGVGSQASIYFTKTANGGSSWTAPTRVDPQAHGHQWFPDIDANAGRLNVVWQDSRADTASGPAGGDFRTVPISNVATAANPPGSVAAPPGVDSYYAVSTDDGGSWLSTRVSAVAQMPQYEQFGNRDVPFFGDYNYISAVGATALMAWTDQRNTVPGTDPRYPVDGMDGFDVLQCRAANPDGSFGADTCPDAGGLDQSIYGVVVP